MTNKANDKGRALEYCLANALIKLLPCKISDIKTRLDQERDEIRFTALPQATQNYYQQQCESVAAWIAQQRTQHFPSPLRLRRLADNEATAGNPADIEISSGEQSYNISLKHNHDAVKHQRPASLYKQLGVKDVAAEQRYRSEIKHIETAFHQLVQTLPSPTTTFNAVKTQSASIIEQLYRDICALVASHLNQYAHQAHLFFSFLVGHTDFDKIIITPTQATIVHFYDISLPSHMHVTVQNNNYIHVLFDNQFAFRMRLHTASSRFTNGKTLSLKFDTQLLEPAPLRQTLLQ